ncbi:MAG: HAD family hydrolase [Clostridia bacterium]|nr:HAD family hydrolase [Clostridia bacterium]
MDMETANNAGMHAVGVSWGYRDETVLRATGADVIVHSPAEILGVIGI